MRAVKNAARGQPNRQPLIDTFRSRHFSLARASLPTERGFIEVTIDEAESPLGWLARRRGRDGQRLIAPHQFMAGERLRADFTLAHLMPRTSSNWDSPISSGGGGGGAGDATDTMVAARQRFNAALEAVGPEFSDLLVDVCCFLRGLEEAERSRAWPTRSAKIVLQLALDRLARHYGYAEKATGKAEAQIRTWLAEGAEFKVESV